MLLRLLLLLCLFFLPQASSLTEQVEATLSDDVPDTCPVTKPYQTSLFVPPSPYPAKASPGMFWFGTDRLWTSLKENPIWKLGRAAPNDPTLREKLFYWRQGYSVDTEPQPTLTVTGRRLDSPAQPLLADKASNGWVNRNQPFIVTAVNFPTVGCWEVTARYTADDLTFVVWISK
jgi:hypothetical protein